MHPSMMAVHAALYTDATTHADEDSRTRPPPTPTEIPLPWLEPTPNAQKSGLPPKEKPAL